MRWEFVVITQKAKFSKLCEPFLVAYHVFQLIFLHSIVKFDYTLLILITIFRKSQSPTLTTRVCMRHILIAKSYIMLTHQIKPISSLNSISYVSLSLSLCAYFITEFHPSLFHITAKVVVVKMSTFFLTHCNNFTFDFCTLYNY